VTGSRLRRRRKKTPTTGAGSCLSVYCRSGHPLEGMSADYGRSLELYLVSMGSPSPDAQLVVTSAEETTGGLYKSGKGLGGSDKFS
jgi:hypothetical protein